MRILDGMSRPMRASGLALLVVAVVAAGVGTYTLVAGDGGARDTAAPTTTASPPPDTQGSQTAPEDSASAAPSTQPGSPSASQEPDTPSSGQPPTTGPSGAPGERGDGDQGQDQQASYGQVSVRVYNNSYIHGLAHTAAEDFRALGWNVVETGNYSGGIIPTSTAYFRPGTDEEFAAGALARQFGMRAEPRFDGIARSSPGVIVIVTKDYQGAVQGK